MKTKDFLFFCQARLILHRLTPPPSQPTRTPQAIKEFLSKKWAKEQDYCLMKELWGFHGNRISARFEYEWHDGQGQWWRSHGNEQWEFDAKGTCGWVRGKGRRIACVDFLD